MASLIRAPHFLKPATPRCGFCMVHHRNKIYLWGGLTQTLNRQEDGNPYPEDHTLPDTDDCILDEYDIQDNSWHCHKTTHDIPDYGKGSTMVGYDNYLFLFGGWNDEDFASDVHRLDLDTFEWKILEVGEGPEIVKPSPRYLTNAIVFKNLMCIFGGTGPIPQGTIQRGAKYIELRQYDYDYGFGWNNEMFFFDLEKYRWSAPALADGRPPPCAGFSFNMVDSHRAMLFGGKQDERRVSDVYIFDFHTMKWSDVIDQKSAADPWPSGRSFHSATCLVDPCRIEQHRLMHCHVDQQLLILWGKGDDSKHCKDAWIYNMDKKTWKKVSEFHGGDDELKARMWHMASSHFTSTTRSDTILFGGNKHRKSNQEINSMHDLTIFSFGVIELKMLCLESIRRHGLERTLEGVPYVAKNQFTRYNNAKFYQLSL